MNYNCVVFSFIVLIYKCNASRIRTTENHHDIFIISLREYEKMVYYTVEVNKPLELRFQNMSISNGSCDDFYERVTKLEATISNSTLYVTNVTYSMSTRWKCKLMKSNITNSQPKYYYLYMNLHVKGAKSVEVTVNDKELSFNVANISVPHDGDAEYLYEDDERIHIVCRNPQRIGTVHLENFMKDVSNISNNATIDIQLHTGSNHPYVDCVYITAEPNDTYVYRVTFVPMKLVNSNENKTSSDDDDQKMPSLLLGCSIGAVLVVLMMAGAACCYMRARTGNNIEIPYGDISNKNENSNSQKNQGDNQYDECHYSDNLSKRETYYETPGSIENMGVNEPYYTEIDYSLCKPKVVETPLRISYVYDEPYL